MSLAHGRDKAKIALIENETGESLSPSREPGAFSGVSVYALGMDLIPGLALTAATAWIIIDLYRR